MEGAHFFFKLGVGVGMGGGGGGHCTSRNPHFTQQVVL